MPGLIRKLIIFAAVDGLVLQPVAQRNHLGDQAVKIDYKSHSIIPFNSNAIRDQHNLPQLESQGIIGLLSVSTSLYLISITQRQQVAQLWGKPVYAITNVALIPVNSQVSAERAINNTVDDLRKQKPVTSTDSDSNDSEDDFMSHEEEVSRHGAVTSSTRTRTESTGTLTSRNRRNSGVVEDVIGRKGAYGRFAENWFSRIGWRSGQRRNLGLSSHEDALEPRPVASPRIATVDNDEEIRSTNLSLEDEFREQQRWPQTPGLEKSLNETHEAKAGQLTESLIPKILQTTKLLLSSKTFFYSYDLDITQKTTSIWRGSEDVPLHRQVASQYYWNHMLSLPFVTNGFDDYALPIMQGFVGQRSFAIAPKAATDSTRSSPDNLTSKDVTVPYLADGETEENAIKNARPEDDPKYLLTLISRRSIDRAGLRYLRRGIDEDGHVANAVETEQILSKEDWSLNEPVHSFVQARGSIPLFYSQTPYTFKPIPVLHGSQDTNQKAMRKHFTELSDRYGKVHAISLVDKHGPEKKIGESYESNLGLINASGGINNREVEFEWFEFHSVCRGMKFENVSFLVDSTLPFLRLCGWTTKAAEGLKKTQSGIIRSNCMDCLDRTNVVQSAFAQCILEQQLSSLGHKIDFRNDPSTNWINTLWADNGDAISRAYAGTAALKGDYTRTRRRNMVGALTDLTLTLSRYYHNLFDDFFAQAVIDYLLGTVTASVFVEFEAKMTTADPGIDLRKARQTAISTAAHVVVEESEDLLAGWALAAPAISNTLRTLPFEEALLLLTEKALYAVRFDWGAEAVRSFERVSLSQVSAIQWGTYITETLTPAQINPDTNVGLVLKFASETTSIASAQDGDPRPIMMTRTNSQSLDNRNVLADSWSITGSDGRVDSHSAHVNGPVIWAYKALPSRSAVVRRAVHDNDDDEDGNTLLPRREREFVSTVVTEIASAISSFSSASSPSSFVTKPDGLEPGMLPSSMGKSGKTGREVAVEEKDIISVAEAKQKTSVLEHLEYNLKKFVWG